MMLAQGGQKDEIFAIPKDLGCFYLYAPLRRQVALVNGAAVAALAAYLDTGNLPENKAGLDFIQSLQEKGFLGEPIPALPLFPGNYSFQPHEVTLFLTSRCNLRCRYCYADAGRKSVDMPWDVARAAIDLVATNAGVLGSRKFAVGFHGGGEPTLAWDILTRCVEYAESKADALGLDVEFFAATNGLLSKEQRRFIQKHFATLNISLDGPADIQDYNRPRVSCGGSYAAIAENLKEFDAAGFNYGLRATITNATVCRMSEIVERLRREFRFSYLHMEPVWQCGRCLTSGEHPPSDEAFAEHYLRAVEMGRSIDAEITYSGARLDSITSKFCAASGDSFTVLPEGIATSCYEVTESEDPRSAIFHYGRFLPSTGRFVFDEERIDKLRKMSVEHLPFCADCFCKWHCAGDCLAKAFQESGESEHKGSPRCALNRSLMLAGLDELIRNQHDTLIAQVMEHSHD